MQLVIYARWVKLAYTFTRVHLVRCEARRHLRNADEIARERIFISLPRGKVFVQREGQSSLTTTLIIERN